MRKSQQSSNTLTLLSRPFVQDAIEADAIIPAVIATLEYLKYSSVTHELPVEFMEAELD